jgi:hypothetical protein
MYWLGLASTLELAHHAVDLIVVLTPGGLVDEASGLICNLADCLRVGFGVPASGLDGPRQDNELPELPQHGVSSFGGPTQSPLDHREVARIPCTIMAW